MTTPETVLLEIIATGPCERSELIKEASDLMTDSVGTEVRASNIPKLLDSLNSLGHIGCTGSRLDTIVVSQLGQYVLDSD